MSRPDLPAATGRRAFLTGATSALFTIAAGPGHAIPLFRRPDPAEPARSLFMVNQRTSEMFHDIYFDGTDYVQEALARFNHLARDMRTGEVGAIEPAVLDLAAELQARVGADKPLVLTHGFRSSATAARRGARNSRHKVGQALDLSHPSIPASGLHREASVIGRGGLGRYRSFIHIDIGPTRRW
ncbi:MAG: YcbK family protein [Roseinatronobacter sp.]